MELNNLHPTIKFTLNHTSPYKCSIQEPFLDTNIWIENGRLFTDLCRKPTDRCQYLLPSSCHPSHITENNPYSLAYRIVRICSTQELRDRRLQELGEFLHQRGYCRPLIQQTIMRAKQIDRREALERTTKREENTIVVFTLQYDPRLQSISSIIKRHCRGPWCRTPG